MARERRRAYRDHEYWGKPVPGFGDPAAPVMLLGLAPGAHGSNRTGRMFTGDASGNFLFPALHRLGFASSPTAIDRHDGLTLRDVYITAAVRCVPPGNKPTPDEIVTCRRWLRHDFQLPNVKVVLALGKIGHDAYIAMLREWGVALKVKDVPFGHGAEYAFDGYPTLLDSFHVSFQNTNTGKLTPAMFDAVLARARELGGLNPIAHPSRARQQAVTDKARDHKPVHTSKRGGTTAKTARTKAKTATKANTATKAKAPMKAKTATKPNAGSNRAGKTGAGRARRR